MIEQNVVYTQTTYKQCGKAKLILIVSTINVNEDLLRRSLEEFVSKENDDQID